MVKTVHPIPGNRKDSWYERFVIKYTNPYSGGTAHVQCADMETYSALTQIIDFSVAFDLISRNDADRSVSFALPEMNGRFVARVQDETDDTSSVVVIEAPVGSGDISVQCNRLYRELQEQLSVQHVVQSPEVQRQLEQRRFWRGLTADNNGRKSRLAIAALVVAIMLLLVSFERFDAYRPDWDVVLVAVVTMLGLSVAALMVTGPRGKVSGRNLALIATAISIVASILLLIAALISQIRYGA